MMDIIRTLLFIFIVNNPPAVKGASAGDPAFLGKWRAVELVQITGSRREYHPQRMVYHFRKDGVLKVYTGKTIQTARWVRKDRALFIVMARTGEHVPFRVRFTGSTADANRVLAQEEITRAVFFIKAMAGKR